MRLAVEYWESRQPDLFGLSYFGYKGYLRLEVLLDRQSLEHFKDGLLGDYGALPKDDNLEKADALLHQLGAAVFEPLINNGFLKYLRQIKLAPPSWFWLYFQGVPEL